MLGASAILVGIAGEPTDGVVEPSGFDPLKGVLGVISAAYMNHKVRR